MLSFQAQTHGHWLSLPHPLHGLRRQAGLSLGGTVSMGYLLPLEAPPPFPLPPPPPLPHHYLPLSLSRWGPVTHPRDSCLLGSPVTLSRQCLVMSPPSP